MDQSQSRIQFGPITDQRQLWPITEQRCFFYPITEQKISLIDFVHFSSLNLNLQNCYFHYYINNLKDILILNNNFWHFWISWNFQSTKNPGIFKVQKSRNYTSTEICLGKQFFGTFLDSKYLTLNNPPPLFFIYILRN